MRRTPSGLWLSVLGLAACNPSEEAFLADYETLWCDQWSLCNPGFETCPTGIEGDDYGPECVFHPDEARRCLKKRDWYCDTSGGEGNEAVIDPKACDQVYECP